MAGPHAALANAVDDNLRGQEAGKQLLERITSGAAVPDDLYHSFTQAATNWGLDGARGLARAVQKQLERATT